MALLSLVLRHDRLVRLLLLASTLSLASCDKAGVSDSANVDPFVDPSASKEGGSTTTALGVAAGGSPNYGRVLEEIQAGGDVLIFLDVEEEIEGIGSQIDGLIRMAGEEGELPAQLRDFDVGGGSSELLNELGFGGIHAIGMSSARRSAGYHNRSFLHTPEGPTGIFDILGGKAQAFNIIDLAPADSDIVAEADLNLQALIDHVQITSRTLGFPEMADAIDGWLDSPMHAALGDTPWRKLYEHLDTELGLVLKMDSDKTMGPFSEGSPELPGLDLLITLEDMGWLADELLAMFPDEQLERASGDGFDSATFAGEIPVSDGVTYKPVVHKDTATNRVLIASSPEHLAACLAADGAIVDSAEFTTATRDLPAKGNCLLFLSEAANTLLMDLVKQAGEQAEGGGMIAKMGLSYPEISHATAYITSVLPDGIQTASNAPMSHKAGAPTGIAFVAGMAVPIYNNIVARAQETAGQRMPSGPPAVVHPVAGACQAYATANAGRYPAQLRDLVTSGDLTDSRQLQWKHPRTGLTVDWVYTSYPDASPGGDQLLLRAPRMVDDKFRIVLVNGTELDVSAEELATISVR